MTSFLLAITLTILLFFSPTLFSCVNASNFIRDDRGKKLINGANYFITSTTPGPEDDPPTVSMAYNVSNIPNCPLFAGQSSGPYTPAVISSYQNSKYIALGANVNVTFLDNLITCNNINQLTWSAMRDDKLIYVVAGYEYPSYGYGSFQVVDAGINKKNVYKFVYCTNDLGCLDVGLLADNSTLAATTDPSMGLISPAYFLFV